MRTTFLATTQYLLCASLLFVTSCASDNDNKVKLTPTKVAEEETQVLPVLPEIELDNAALSNAKVAGVYIGKLPCADCEVIEYRLELLPNGDYIDEVFYKGKGTEPSNSIGKYSFTKNNLINLGKYLPGMNLFAKTQEGLLMLNDDGSRITGADEKRYQLLPENKIPKKFKSLDEQYFKDGISLYAQGEKNEWSMTLNYQKGYQFFLPNNEMLEFNVAEAEILSDYEFRYNSSGSGGELTLTINFASRCQNNSTGDLLDCHVTAEIKRQNGKKVVLNGCGNFVTYPDFFETTWQLVSINKATADISDYEIGLPTIQFGKAQRDFRGIDGCNEIGGQYYLSGDKLVFNQFASTAKSCPNMGASRDFNFCIQGNMYSYVLYDGQLTLTNLKNTLVFTKAK